jgi:EAL domain-containing protein (putative c-di-GMP-specific phosphodiesterase class I)/GGDEF domain-containing protein
MILILSTWFRKMIVTFLLVIVSLGIINLSPTMFQKMDSTIKLSDTEIRKSIVIIVNYLIVFMGLYILFSVNNTKRLEKYVKNLLYVDIKTSCFNERQFEYDFEKSMRKNKRIIVIAVDFLNLLNLNRQFGYRMIQPEFLKRIQLLKKSMSLYGRVYKFEGPLFAFVIPIDEFNQAEVEKHIMASIYELKNSKIEQSNNYNFETQWLATYFPNDGFNAKQIVDNIYHLKYVPNKLNGSIQWYNQEAFEKERRNIRLEQDLIEALKKNEIYIVLQPQLTIADQRIHCTEILARWKHPEFGNVSPVEFIPMIEKLGLMNELTKSVLLQALQIQKKIEARTTGEIKFAINMSAISISDFDFIQFVKSFNQSFEVEITESTLITMEEHENRNIAILKDAGFTIAIDDFGTGFSNLEYLHAIDVDILKIDKRFVDSMMVNEKALKLVEALISMAHKLDIQVVAEGVETSMQYEVLRGFSCDLIQGYWFSKPLLPEDFLAFINKTGYSEL